MKVLFALALVGLAAALTLPGDSEAELRQAFDQFKYQFGKTYAPTEEPAKYEAFKESIARAKRNNMNEPYKPYGITKFSDMTAAEFKDKILMKVNYANKSRDGEMVKHGKVDIDSLPTSFDWRDKTPDCVTPVKNQEQCGSCWAFSGVETLESVCCLAGYPLTKLSEQEIVDCDHVGGCQGCNGGYMQDVYVYYMQEGGIETEADYPYHAVDQTCQADKSKNYKCPVTSWKWVSQKGGDEPAMQQFLYENSPLSIGVDAETWQDYTSGVIMGGSCGQQIDHGVQAVGWEVVQGTKAWIVRNSWGADWGVQGHVYLQFGKNTCAIADWVTVPCATDKTGKSTC